MIKSDEEIAEKMLTEKQADEDEPISASDRLYLLRDEITLPAASEDEARLLLQHAFINEVLRHVQIDHLYDRLAHLVDLRFRGELGKCRGCNLCK